mmetsp:Transcript_5912/g.10489  ORF Transcript_5912/g.10489 Transcript_5912/m.10489 type:complete len:83 (+) Transcript_5912:299-547(+)
MENRADPATEASYLYLDPKAARSHQNRPPEIRRPFQKAVLFVVGGGNYVEYQNILDHLKPGRSVVYGTTDLCSSEEFVSSSN